MKKVYKCCICKKELDYKPIRLIKQKHNNIKPYGRYKNIKCYDFCKRCYQSIQKWLDKYKGDEV